MSPFAAADGTEAGRRAHVGKQLTETAQETLCPNNEHGALLDLLNSCTWIFKLAIEGENRRDCRRSSKKTYSENAVEQSQSRDGDSQTAAFRREKTGDVVRVYERQTLRHRGDCL